MSRIRTPIFEYPQTRNSPLGKLSISHNDPTTQSGTANSYCLPLKDVQTRPYMEKSGSECQFELPFLGQPLRQPSNQSFQEDPLSSIQQSYEMPSRQNRTIVELPYVLQHVPYEQEETFPGQPETILSQESQIRRINESRIRSSIQQQQSPHETPRIMKKPPKPQVINSPSPSSLPPLPRRPQSVISSARSQLSHISQQDNSALISFLSHVNTMTTGIELKKYGRKDLLFPSKRFLQLSPDLKHLVIRTDSHKIRRMLPLHHIMQIQIGRRTENFKRFKATFDNKQRSCSLMMKERTLDLEAQTLKDLDAFVQSLSSILRVLLGKGFIGVDFE